MILISASRQANTGSMDGWMDGCTTAVQCIAQGSLTIPYTCMPRCETVQAPTLHYRLQWQGRGTACEQRWRPLAEPAVNGSSSDVYGHPYALQLCSHGRCRCSRCLPHRACSEAGLHPPCACHPCRPGQEGVDHTVMVMQPQCHSAHHHH